MRQTNRIRHAEEEKKREGKCHGILFGRMGAVYMGNDKKRNKSFVQRFNFDEFQKSR